MKRSRRRARRNPINPWLSLLLPAATGAIAGTVVQMVIDGNQTPTAGAPLAGAAVGALAGALGEALDKDMKKAAVGLVGGLALGAGAYYINQQDMATAAAAQANSGTNSTTGTNQLPGSNNAGTIAPTTTNAAGTTTPTTSGSTSSTTTTPNPTG